MAVELNKEQQWCNQILDSLTSQGQEKRNKLNVLTNKGHTVAQTKMLMEKAKFRKKRAYLFLQDGGCPDSQMIQRSIGCGLSAAEDEQPDLIVLHLMNNQHIEKHPENLDYWNSVTDIVFNILGGKLWIPRESRHWKYNVLIYG